ncbi:MAG: transporter substrate-binding domain-containing protein [Deltaproteobacteria bacterium]|nr:transporter substrate-binding domain-containing protein [Deltaproteobacteria bacterium]
MTAGEVGHEYAKAFLPKAELTVMTTEDISRPMLEVIAGRADVALGDSLTCYRFAKEHAEVRNVFARRPVYVYGTTVMLRRGDPDWLDFINTTLEFMEVSGITARLEAKYKQGAEEWLSKRPPYVTPGESGAGTGTSTK